MKTFKINDVELEYCRDSYNCAWENERSCEVALGRYFLGKFNNDVLEAGAVMPYYSSESHKIIDLTDPHPKSEKANALYYDYKGKNVLSISSIEHMMTSEYGNGTDVDSIIFLENVIKNAANYLITWGVGYNSMLDLYMRINPQVPRFILKRISADNQYIVHHNPNDFSFPFGHSDRPIPPGFFNNANGVCVVTNLTELLK